ncbi:MAG: primosomal protein N' [Bombilactobacillus mellifer]|uniref:primosomal protein N' n=1 Tax=Bombilactobacillus mellifer TaxID=1218492 RepID=UPI0023F6E335|nr:primosomal protein N' [Bombilactobacillus mellifer]MCT6894365.1 primosomal protein N' [Bombilactobacillus mellifer]
MYAQVVVDVPTQQTDHSFDYLIPAALEKFIVAGQRVVVPFGRSGRRVQGFIVGTSTTSSYAQKCKPIAYLIDLQPVLSSELLQLSQWLANRTFAFWVDCLQTMLPNVMRAKYSKKAWALTSTVRQSALFQGAAAIPVPNDLTQQRQLAQWQKQGQVRIDYLVENKAQTRQQLVLNRVANQDYAHIVTQVKPQAAKQRQLLQLFIDHPDWQQITYTALQQKYQIGNSVIKAAIAHGWFTRSQIEIRRNPYTDPVTPSSPQVLTAEQRKAYQTIITSASRPVLLEGVTGSGKTEVYLQVIEHFLQQHKTALMLVPEISLTPQMVTRVRARFGGQVAVLHSGLSQGERYDEWRRINQQQAQVVVGARSAVFAPLRHLGVIIIDEEHEASYKQIDNPRYHARDVALWRGRYHHCPVVLGSATPSLESRARGQKRVYQLVQMPHRVYNQPLPQVQIVDLREQQNLALELNSPLQVDLSQPLITALHQCLKKHEQAILLLNRRGYANFLLCRNCGFVPHCPNCDITLTVHLQEHCLLCHYCGHREPIMKQCQVCGSSKLRLSGTGTQKVETQLQELLPQARVLRMDNDTTTRKGAHQRILQQFAQQQADILLGTQMIAKGLDFPNVTLVGVINADTGLGINDFRANERTFQLLTQVSGRAGRKQKLGQVFIQTYNPDNYAIQLASQQDYEAFYRQEMQFRHQGHYPPYFFLIKITISHQERAQAFKMAYNVAKRIKPILQSREQLLGPVQPTVARIKNRYYYQIIIKYRHNQSLGQLLHQIMNNVQIDKKRGFAIAIDNEPQQME